MKTKKLLLVAFILLGIGVGMIACKKETTPPVITKPTPPTPTPKDCPTDSSNISLPDHTIGAWKIGAEGGDGTSVDGTLLTNHGWIIYNGEIGGVDHTYAVTDSSGAIIMRWRWGGFDEFIVGIGWHGQTEKGVKMGDLLSFVQTKYPDLVLVSPYTNVFSVPTDSYVIEMNFNPTTWMLEQIDVSHID